ncbi:prepilin-type N-terminal cleavage/methylation domain-containing protein [Epsilonproteobacteria bacterium SCGC AD-308-P11]|jgi:prepilin-type N-terminal cleavage/methylation domain-containing protein|nr:prepilin-type N-terminal cleavage/methylation domain-containing protein [Epsilonproteobacteria bacterium SCGC AD-308-P11]
MKKAFTLLELVFVIVIIGILSVVIMPRVNSNGERDAAVQLLSHITYTQHLAMIDDKFDSTNATWFRNRWQIRFNGNQYSVVSNNNTVFAKDTMNSGNDFSNIDLNAKFSTTVALSGSCLNETIISFDHLGRPIVGDLSATTSAYTAGQPIQSACIITLTNGTANVVINIERETGYTHII